MKGSSHNWAILCHGYAADDPYAMGATVLNAVGDNPARVAVVVADCAYTSVWNEFAFQEKQIFSLYDQTAKIKIPVLFIHGQYDTFVPVWMGLKNYEVCQATKQFILKEGAVHANSVYKDKEYGDKVYRFLDEHMK